MLSCSYNKCAFIKILIEKRMTNVPHGQTPILAFICARTDVTKTASVFNLWLVTCNLLMQRCGKKYSGNVFLFTDNM